MAFRGWAFGATEGSRADWRKTPVDEPALALLPNRQNLGPTKQHPPEPGSPIKPRTALDNTHAGRGKRPLLDLPRRDRACLIFVHQQATPNACHASLTQHPPCANPTQRKGYLHTMYSAPCQVKKIQSSQGDRSRQVAHGRAATGGGTQPRLRGNHGQTLKQPPPNPVRERGQMQVDSANSALGHHACRLHGRGTRPENGRDRNAWFR
ncbi:hypothetical protein EV126DRAFT_425577 [Verticillium dahliae]|nr:hypothetical protein EV126DRAFT_425577 [Verticillium dahliae]